MMNGGTGQFQELVRPQPHSDGQGSESAKSESTAAGAGKYTCPNCSKSFARDDLLRRHLAREARAAAQPQVDRQKSCHECARSKARCDLEVPSCGRCRSRGKQCTYGARSGNPNVRRHRESAAPTGNMETTGGSTYGGGWASAESSYQGSEGPPDNRNMETSTDDSGSESSYGWSDQNATRNHSIGSSSYLPQRSYSGVSIPAPPSQIGNQPPPLPQTLSQHHQQYVPHHSGGSGPYQLEPSSSVTPTTWLARHGLEQPYGPAPALVRPSPANMLMADLDRSGSSFKAEEGEETPIGRFSGAFTSAIGASDTRTGIQRTVTSPGGAGHPELWNNVAAPPMGSQQPYVPQSGERMGPPSLPFSNARNIPSLLSPSRGPGRQRPQPHKLLTGVNMPQPPRPDIPGAGAHLLSGRPLFSAIMDLSGWLEEPVVPSPLYQTGPTLSNIGVSASAQGSPAASQGVDQASMAVDPPSGQSQSSTTENRHSLPQPSHMPASRYWWANPPSQMDVALMQSVAQATATHLSHYPHLMVLPDPSSPVPPTVHRPWMAHVRGELPASLAIARVVLAGYAVRLPASEHIVWEAVTRETRRLIQAHESICNHSGNLEVLGATEALFLYSILLLMCTDSGASPYVDMSLTNTAFFALSQLAKTLSARLQMVQKERARRKSMGEDETDGQGQPDQQKQTWLFWGFEETMRRTLWASYAILVLQRFRDGAVLSEGHLAGLDLILDIQLPAVAAEFEAASETEWSEVRKQSLAASSEGTMAGPGPDGSVGHAAGTPAASTGGEGGGAREERPITCSDLTFRDIIRYRPVTASRRGSNGAPAVQNSASSDVLGESGSGRSGSGASLSRPIISSSSSATNFQPVPTTTGNPGTDTSIDYGGTGAGTGTGGGNGIGIGINLGGAPPPPPPPLPLQAPKALLDYFDRHDAFVATVLSIAFCLDSSLSI